jgi:flagellar hook-basal body complex protein FliE
VNVRPEKLESAAEPLNNLLAEFNEVGYREFGSTKEIDDFKEKLKNVIKDVNKNIYYHAEGMGLYKT